MASWSKQNEIDYINGLVTGSVFQRSHVRETTTEQVLVNYIKSARKRMEFGTYVLGGEEVIQHAQNALDKERLMAQTTSACP
jgi:hypothetical protein